MWGSSTDMSFHQIRSKNNIQHSHSKLVIISPYLALAGSLARIRVWTWWSSASPTAPSCTSRDKIFLWRTEAHHQLFTDFKEWKSLFFAKLLDGFVNLKQAECIQSWGRDKIMKTRTRIKITSWWNTNDLIKIIFKVHCLTCITFLANSQGPLFPIWKLIWFIQWSAKAQWDKSG